MLRCAAGLPTKDLLTFIDVVRLCTSHRFMLAQAKFADQDPFYEESEKHNRETGDPVELLYDVQLDDIIKLMSRAGIYLHTCNP